ncbi:putative glycosyltransferase-like isoform X1 [Capsicum annuum]|nr:putative glycosyltransferase-like isoform X1 [Capsicum annuum]KAF3644686.1 putative glycosyltransferase-like isoform X1 [Capsicum annuum]
MKTDVEMKVYTMDEDESWQLFAKNVGNIVNLEQIHPLAKEVARDCDGLALAIIDIELSSEQISKHVNKKRGDIQSCFLYCSLYPATIPIDDLIHCWWAEGILGEHETYEEAYNWGITLIESLKDVCLLEADKMEIVRAQVVDCVKMHDVVRDVARWIASTFGDEHTSVFQAGIGLTEISHIKISASVKRISFVSNKIECLPDCLTKCPKTTSLHLQDNKPLAKIPKEFFLAFPALRVLNLSRTGIRELPYML